MFKWMTGKKRLQADQRGIPADPIRAINALAEKILLDHREHSHRVFLISSAMDADCVKSIGDALAKRLRRRCDLNPCVIDHAPGQNTHPLCRRLADGLSQGHDLILLILPGLLTGNFPATVLNNCDSFILVVMAGKTRKVHVRETLRYMATHKIPALGTVLFNTPQIIPTWLYHRCFRRGS